MSLQKNVCDNQEPALIIANGASCSLLLLRRLLESAPLVVVLDSAIERVIGLEIKVDVLLGDFDRDFDPEIYCNAPFFIKIVHAPDENKTDLEKAFDYLIERGIVTVNVVWATGRRADHTITNLTNIVRYRNLLQIVILDDHSKIFLLPKEFKKYYIAKTPLSLIPVGVAKGLFSTNLKYPLKNDTLTIGYRTGSSNSVAADGIVSISHTDGDLLLMECMD